MHQDDEAIVARIAVTQFGVVARRQLLAAGLSGRQIDHLVASGRLNPMHAGVYRVAGVPTSTTVRLMAAQLATNGATSHGAAASYWSFEGFVPGRPEVSVRRRSAVRTDGIIVHHPRALDELDIAYRGSLAITTPARTIVDVAPRLSVRRLGFVIDTARRRKLTNLSRTWEAMNRRGDRGVPGKGKLKIVLDKRTEDVVSGSTRQTQLQELIERCLPALTIEHSIYDDDGFIGRVDMCYPDARIVIEYDGGQHEDELQKKADRKRDRRLRRIGWLVLRYDRDDLRTHADVVAEVREALDRRTAAAFRQ